MGSLVSRQPTFVASQHADHNYNPRQGKTEILCESPDEKRPDCRNQNSRNDKSDNVEREQSEFIRRQRGDVASFCQETDTTDHTHEDKKPADGAPSNSAPRDPPQKSISRLHSSY